MKEIRIAIFVTSAFPAPPPSSVIYAPIVVAMDTAQGLAARGHEVTFFSPKGSHITGVTVHHGNLEPFHAQYPHDPLIFQQPDIRHAEREKIITLWDQRLLSELYRMERKGAFDIIHSHTPDRTLPFGFVSTTPTVYTLHTPVMTWHKDIFGLFATPNQYFVSISDAQRTPAPNLSWAKTIYNGLDLSLFPFAPRAQSDAFLFLGRLLPSKGLAESVEATRLASEKLMIVGGPQPRNVYWNTHVAQYLSNAIQYKGMLPYNETFSFYQRARALLAPIQWEEPFGLTMIEAMACGTPVIAFRRGSVPEIVKDGVTGFVVDTVEEMAAAMKKIDSIDRAACRRHVEQHFTVERMVDDYEKVFQKILAAS